MKNVIVGIMDKDSGRIEEIYSMASEGMAIKQLSRLIEARKERTGETLETKLLFLMGKHDIETGLIEPEKAPKMIPWNSNKPIESEAEKED